jgi:tripartite-type tricarboxylate transporter receptor subunit TctC
VPQCSYAVPRGTPQPVVDRIAAGFADALKTPRVRELLQKQGLEPVEATSLNRLAALQRRTRRSMPRSFTRPDEAFGLE